MSNSQKYEKPVKSHKLVKYRGKISKTLKFDFGISDWNEYKKIISETMKIIYGKKTRLKKDYTSQTKFAYVVYCKYKCEPNDKDMQNIWNKTNKITQNMCDRLKLYEKILNNMYTPKINKKENRVIFLDKKKIIYSIKMSTKKESILIS